MTQQTLREEYYKWYWGDSTPSEDTHLFYASRRTNGEIADFFLARFKEFAEKELIGAMEKPPHEIEDIEIDQSKGLTISNDNAMALIDRGRKVMENAQGAEYRNARNALRNEQRKILSEKLK